MDVRPIQTSRLGLYLARHLTPLEVRWMERLVPLQRIRPLSALMMLASRLGDWPLWVATALVLLSGDERQRLAAWSGLAAVTVSVALFKLVKNLIGRPRPFERWESLSCLMAVTDRFSFPSGHTMTAFAVCGALAPILPALLPGYLFAAVLIGLSRVYLGLHYPTDVLVGALAGSALGLTAARLALSL